MCMKGNGINSSYLPRKSLVSYLRESERESESEIKSPPPGNAGATLLSIPTLLPHTLLTIQLPTSEPAVR